MTCVASKPREDKISWASERLGEQQQKQSLCGNTFLWKGSQLALGVYTMKNLSSGKETNKGIPDGPSKLTISMWNATCYSTSTTSKSINYIPQDLKAFVDLVSSRTQP